MSAGSAHSFNKVLTQPKYASKSRASSSDPVDDASKKLRRMILVDGIPSTAVGFPVFVARFRLRTSSIASGSNFAATDMEDFAQNHRPQC